MEDECAALEQQGRILEDDNARLQRTLALASWEPEDEDDEEAEDQAVIEEEDEDEEEEKPEEENDDMAVTDDEAESAGHHEDLVGEEGVTESEYLQHRAAQELLIARSLQISAQVPAARSQQPPAQSPIYVPDSPYPHPQVISVAPSPFDQSLAAPALDPVQIRNALSLNREYQDLLTQQLRNIEAARQRNLDYQKRIKALIIHSQKKTVRKPGTRSFTAPYFATASGEVPPDNRDARERKAYFKQLPHGFKFRKWTESEKKTLATLVQNQNRLIRGEQLRATRKSMTAAEYDKKCQEIRKIPPAELEMNLQGLDWEAISHQMNDNHYTRTAMDCKIQWTQNQWPGIEIKKKWTKQDDQRLLALAAKYKGHNWVAIAAELGTNRTPAQCFARYQRSLNTNMMRNRWLPEEDRQLREAVEKYGQKNWQQVAYCLRDRTGQQCLHRWQKSLSPEIKRGRWQPQEDMMLVLAVTAYGPPKPDITLPWVEIREHVPGRTDVQCRERWMNILNPELNSGPWSEEEDAKLREAIEMYGKGKWSLISKVVRTRTDNQCWRRWKALNSGAEVEEYRKNINKKRKGLVNNFVGREKERPELTVDDFEIEEDESQAARRKRIRTEESVDSPTIAPLSPTPISLPATLLNATNPSILPIHGPPTSTTDSSTAPPLPTLAGTAGIPRPTTFSTATPSLIPLPVIAIVPGQTAPGAPNAGTQNGKPVDDLNPYGDIPGPKKRGRPRKAVPPQTDAAPSSTSTTPSNGRGRGKPRTPKNKVGRPRKSTASKITASAPEPTATAQEPQTTSTSPSASPSSLSARRRSGMTTRSKSAAASTPEGASASNDAAE